MSWGIRIFDITLASLLLTVFSPLLLVVAVAIRVESPGPVLFRQVRVGHRGRPFTIFKFRTMRQEDEGAEPAPAPRVEDFRTYVFSPPGVNPRVTPLGRVLRKTSIDELPQLANVVRGDMSLVGPRPELPDLVAQYPAAYHRRHDVPPGITGLAQINGRSDLTYHQTMLYDLAYVEHRSLALNVKILLKTLPSVLKGTGAR